MEHTAKGMAAAPSRGRSSGSSALQLLLPYGERLWLLWIINEKYSWSEEQKQQRNCRSKSQWLSFPLPSLPFFSPLSPFLFFLFSIFSSFPPFPPPFFFFNFTPFQLTVENCTLKAEGTPHCLSCSCQHFITVVGSGMHLIYLPGTPVSPVFSLDTLNYTAFEA